MYFILGLLLITGCTRPRAVEEPPRIDRVRHGDEIVVAGEYFRTGAPVVLWNDPGGYDAYDTSPRGELRYGGRFAHERAAGDWTLPELRGYVDQFVLHYDVCGVSARCFDVLHNARTLSVHFMLDIDGTIYQTLDVQERAWHATKANDRSVGVEIANMGAYTAAEREPFDQWYATDAYGTHLVIPESIQRRYGPTGGVRDTRIWPLRPARNDIVTGQVHDRMLRQYDLTPQQYESLAKLAAALNRALPGIRLDYPRDENGQVLLRKLTDTEFAAFRGVLGHWHVQENKVDPGPAMDWDRVVGAAHGAQ